MGQVSPAHSRTGSAVHVWYDGRGDPGLLCRQHDRSCATCQLSGSSTELFCQVSLPGVTTVSGSHRVIRGGSWNNDTSNCRSAYRNNATPGNRNGNLGFRLLSTRLRQRRASTDSPRVHQVMSRPSSCAGAGRPNSPVPRRLVGPAGAKTAAGCLVGSKSSMGMRLTTYGCIDCLVPLPKRH